MKWAKLKSEIGNRFPRDGQSIREVNGSNHQEGLKDLEKQLIKEGEEPLGLWVTHSFKEKIKIREREGYEIFVTGFLYYYDVHTRNNSVNHNIYFEWFDIPDISGNSSVKIYISPPPMPNLLNEPGADPNKVAIDPPRPPAPPPPPMG